MSELAVQDRELIVAPVRELLGRVAPSELPLLDETVDAFLTRPSRPRAARDEPLGFGGPELAVVTHAALWATFQALAFARDIAKKAAQEEGASRLRRALARVRRTPQQQADLTLTSDQLRAVRRTTHDTATEAGLPERDASLLADAVVGRLVASANAAASTT
jgi:hypothetical protein